MNNVRLVFDDVVCYLHRQRSKVSSDRIVDATIINVPNSTKNAAGERDPESHQTRKGTQEYSGMNAHLGIDGLFKQESEMLAEPNDRALAQTKGYTDGQISRERGDAAPKYALVGRDEYCLGFRAGYFASERELSRVKHQA